MDEDHKYAPAILRRKRNIARQHRGSTPDPLKTGKNLSDEESSSTTDQIDVSIQIRPSETISNHRNKILNRKNKSCSGRNVERSLSSPRAENNGKQEVFHLLRCAKRSLSSPRCKEELSEDSSISQTEVISQRFSDQKSDNEKEKNLSRHEMNLRRFEDERRKFELEKNKFEREKRKLVKMRYRHYDIDDKKRIMNTYTKLSDRLNTTESATKRKMIKSFIQTKNELHYKYLEEDTLIDYKNIAYESSTVSSSDSEAIKTNADNADNEDNRNELNPAFKQPEYGVSSLKQRNVGNVQITTENVLMANEIKSNETEKKSSFFFKFFRIFFKKQKSSYNVNTSKKLETQEMPSQSCISLLINQSKVEWKGIIDNYPDEIELIRLNRNICISKLIVMLLFCGFGGLIFRFVEGSFENMYKCGVRRVKRDFIDQLWLSSFNLKEDDWKSSARTKLRQFEEELHAAHEAGMISYSGLKSWNFVNSVLYCMTVITTIGYGHIAPTTVVGRAITIIYAIIGIPMFLILLADFGKLFTRCIKFLWAYVRRVYYTGSCRKVRKQAQVQEMMRGINMVYDIAIRRPSAFIRDIDLPEAGKSIGDPETPQSTSTHLPPPSSVDTPTSPYPETFEIDDEFNLPISVATTVLLLYIFVGAAVYCMWEEWSYFESFYFVFISMSTIGFGDYVPKHPVYMMSSIVYLVFGLALTSMCINVVQVKLSDSFKHASAKIGATIGLTLAEEEARNSQNQTPAELVSVHSGMKLDDIPEGNTEENQNNNEFIKNNNNNKDDHPPVWPRRNSNKP